MIEKTTLAYLAGAMDSDGSFGIKKSTYHIRVRKDAHNPVYSERIALKQVTPEIPRLLQQCFGGGFRLTPPQTGNSKPLYSFMATDLRAAHACVALLPYLKVKGERALILLELRKSKSAPYRQLSYWFAQEHPQWEQMELITRREASNILGYKNATSVSQAIRNGTLLSLRYGYTGEEQKAIPRDLVEQLKNITGAKGRVLTPPQLMKWRGELWQKVREMNKVGINGTPLFYRTGPYTPALP